MSSWESLFQCPLRLECLSSSRSKDSDTNGLIALEMEDIEMKKRKENIILKVEEEVEIKVEIEKGRDVKLSVGLGDEINTKYMKTHYQDLIAFCAAKHENETTLVEEK